ncbi:MAG: Glycosyltransferase [bacterium]|nr:MAG: Glycosyltransferase [bacterium]KAF0148244.1 MAG: Glycosyltransferase [bacterium]KAF0167739.1 MAG: Glycosyltransferase [bacterium]TXT20132.1 MAG: Glycosyltransferase [bacterium]
MSAQVSILLPHYRTLDLTRFCLRSLRKYTDPARIQVIVIDNGSQDASTAYLRGLSWITLIERAPIPGEGVAAAHARALDLGLEQAMAPYVLSMHTDTIITSPRWLDYLLGEIEGQAQVAGVGSWKLEFKPWYRRLAKLLDPAWCALRARLPRRFRQRGPSKKDNHYLYLRSHCALYRTELLRRFSLSFDENDVAGKVLHRKLEDLGFTLKFLDIHGLSSHVRHINHATMILNPEISGRKTGTDAERRRVRRELESLNYRRILEDDGLDR